MPALTILPTLSLLISSVQSPGLFQQLLLHGQIKDKAVMGYYVDWRVS